MSVATLEPPVRILVERRFPLDLSRSIVSIRELYDAAKQRRWNPERDVPWAGFDAGAYEAPVRDAAALGWSRRAWIEYTGLPETPALLIRFCLELGRESDPKYFLTVRNTEEAWHVECFHRLAGLAGGYVKSPESAAQEALFNRAYHRRALDADRPLDAYFAAYSAVEDGLDLELYRAAREAARDAVVREMLARVVEDKERHAAFGWLYLEERAPHWSAEDRRRIGEEILDYVEGIELKGYRCPWLATDGSATAAAAAVRLAGEAGLGFAPQERERAVLADYFGNARARLREFGIELPMLSHALLGRF